MQTRRYAGRHLAVHPSLEQLAAFTTTAPLAPLPSRTLHELLLISVQRRGFCGLALRACTTT